jgi:hypothetical protein
MRELGMEIKRQNTGFEFLSLQYKDLLNIYLLVRPWSHDELLKPLVCTLISCIPVPVLLILLKIYFLITKILHLVVITVH